ncbi:BTAD domain-containing putative transcriptional regulator [Streptomyces sp. SID13031]|uniref:AfsR/SARP family transcriptional regulator n=1 Tax=Streptomyces sp. SID13031 TaxID=2706046 RepID=UPI0013CB1FB4|nr:BTAD domain-containing putative transcriptional regulator [Streptomyces sp. SID13031]NEA31241.1 SARP family transcriptional regulator [Streptomyces sp. SID13031]
MAEVEIRLLGPFELLVDGRPVDLPAQRLRAVLAGLAVRPREVIGADSLASVVWEDAELPHDVRSTLQAYVVRLRAVIGQELIKTVGEGYLLEIDGDQVDASRFARLAGLRIDDRAAAVNVLALWRGDPFTGVGSALLLEVAAPPLVETRLAVVERLTDLDIAAERHGDGLAELEELAESYPLRESLWARLIVVLARSGRRADALDRYSRIRRRIADELGGEPGPQLRLIHSELLLAETRDSASTSGAVDRWPVPRRLLPCDPWFTGRTEELTRLDKALAEGVRTVVIHGVEGAGKTALATQWAHRVLDRFPGGQLYLDLGRYRFGHRTSAEEAAEILLGGLGFRPDQPPAGFARRMTLLRSTLASRRILLVLDNVIDVDQVRPLLPETCSLAVVISRSPLNDLLDGNGKASLRLGCLSFGDSLELLGRGVRPVKDSSDGVLAELTELCDRLPLALVIAAEQVAGLTDAQIRHLVVELRVEQTRLNSLGTGTDSPTSVRVVLSSSYRALDGETARLFRLLGLHPGVSFSLPAAAALASLSVADAARSLTLLVEAHLLQGVSIGRFELHDLVHSFAMEMAITVEPPAQRTAVVRRILSWYLHSAESAQSMTMTGKDPAPLEVPAAGLVPLRFDSERQASDWFESEYATLVAVVLDAVGNGDHGLAGALVDRMHGYLSVRRSPADGLELQEAAMTAAVLRGDLRAAGVASSSLGSFYGHVDSYPSSGRRYERYLARFRNAGAIVTKAVALGNLGMAEELRGQWLCKPTNRPSAGRE